MIIYYCENFEGSKKESRKLLSEAVMQYLISKKNFAPECADSIKDAVSGTNSIIQTGGKGKPHIDMKEMNKILGTHSSFPLEFSVSHTGHFWSVLLGDEQCGFDIQNEREGRLMKIAKKFYNINEIEYVEKYGKRGFYIVWTMREAFIKAIGEDVLFATPELISDGMEPEINIEYLDETWYIQTIELPIETLSAICTKKNITIEIEVLK